MDPNLNIKSENSMDYTSAADAANDQKRRRQGVFFFNLVGDPVCFVIFLYL